MKIKHYPRGVCSQYMEVDVEDGVINGVQVVGGCDGNSKGVISLLTGMKVEEAVAKLEGIRCGYKSTSCPDQLAHALKQAL